jgi:predicted Zn-dependent protease
MQLPRASAQIYTDAQSELRVAWLQMKREMPQYPSEAVQQYAQCIAWAIIAVIPVEYQNLNWEVIVFDNDAKNASVTPEGKIAVFSGLLQVANTPDELAAVIGHEVAHLTEGHVRDRVLRAAGTGLLGVLGSAATGFGRESQTAANVMFQLPFQRGQESEADLKGMEFMAAAGYNPAAVLQLWRDMSAGGDNRGSNWLTTHPNPQDRMQDMASNLSPALVAYNAALDAGVRPRCRLGR